MTTPDIAVSPTPAAAPAGRPRVLSGMRSTGLLHLGNYLGALNNWVGLQERFDCYFMVADWHALTSEYADSSTQPGYVRAMALDWLAAGLDPERSVLFIQSKVKEHAELALLLGMFAPVPWLERCPSFKDMQTQVANKDLNTYGFLGYPVLQTADIVLYKAGAVPVGEDQLAHLEICRELIRRVHNFIKREIFPEPAPLLSPVPKLTGLDGRKMSKSYGNCVYLSDSAPALEAKVKEMITDPARVRRKDPGHPEVCSVYGYHEVFTPEAKDEIAADCRTAALGCVDCKKRLMGSLNRLLDPMRERRAALEAKPGTVEEILNDGETRARRTAAATMAEFREALSLPA